MYKVDTIYNYFRLVCFLYCRDLIFLFQLNMSDTATPVTGVWSSRRPNSILRTVPCGTPFRTPDRRRFGPLGIIEI